MFAVFIGLGIALAFDWKITLIGLGTVPFMAFGSFVNAKVQKGYTGVQESMFKDANVIVLTQ